jgi:multidrug efflux system membrane fusion protein
MSVRSACLGITVLVAAPLWTQPLNAAAAGAIRAVTRPSADITLSFVQPGRIAQVPHKEGDSVKMDQVLARQDDVAEQILLAQLKAQADDLIQIQAAEASLEQKKVDLAKLEKAAASNAATSLEVEHARLDVTIAALSLALSQFEHEQACRKYQEQEIRVKNMQIKSPIDGRIEQIDIEAGECINALENAVRVVRIDPLWIDAPVPLQEAGSIHPGMVARIRTLGTETDGNITEGRVVFVGAVADAASGTLRVRIEVPNESGRPAGEHVLVDF